MKNKLLFSVAALTVAFGASNLSARSLNTFDESARKEIGAYSDRVNAAVEMFGGSFTGKPTPLMAVTELDTEPAWGFAVTAAQADEKVMAFLVKELNLNGKSSKDDVKAALEAKLRDEKAAHDLLINFADVLATAAAKHLKISGILDAKVTALVEAKKTAEEEAKAKTEALTKAENAVTTAKKAHAAAEKAFKALAEDASPEERAKAQEVVDATAAEVGAAEKALAALKAATPKPKPVVPALTHADTPVVPVQPKPLESPRAPLPPLSEEGDGRLESPRGEKPLTAEQKAAAEIEAAIAEEPTPQAVAVDSYDDLSPGAKAESERKAHEELDRLKDI